MKMFILKLFYYITNFKTFIIIISQRYNFLRHRWIFNIKTALNRADFNNKIAVLILKFNALFIKLFNKGKVYLIKKNKVSRLCDAAMNTEIL